MLPKIKCFQIYDKSAGDQETVFAILYCFRYLEAFGSIWILTVFAILHRFDTERQISENSKTSKCFQK